MNVILKKLLFVVAFVLMKANDQGLFQSYLHLILQFSFAHAPVFISLFAQALIQFLLQDAQYLFCGDMLLKLP